MSTHPDEGAISSDAQHFRNARNLAELISVELMSKGLEFPVKTWDEAAKALGETTSFEVHGRPHRVRDHRSLFPEWYFPIESKDHLTVVIAHHMRRFGNQSPRSSK